MVPVVQVFWSAHFSALGPVLLWGNVMACLALAHYNFHQRHNALLTMWRLLRLGFAASPLYPVCWEVEEGIIHMFFGCPKLIDFIVWASEVVGEVS